MEDRYHAYGIPSPYDRDPRVRYPGYLAPEGSLASRYASSASRPSVLPGGTDVLRNDVALQPRAYGLDGPAGVINPVLPGMSGLPAGARAQGPTPLDDPYLSGLSGVAPARAPVPTPVEDPYLSGLSGLAPARAPGPTPVEDPYLSGLKGLAPDRAPGPSPSEEPAVVGRSSSLGKGASIPDVERHSPLLNLDGPAEDESNILFVDGLPTDCTRREVAHLFRLCPGFKDIRVVHKESRHGGDRAYVLCFVEFENAKFAFAAMNRLKEYRFDDRKPEAPFLNIQFARFPFRRPSAYDDRGCRTVR